jgi:hypothetical protein
MSGNSKQHRTGCDLIACAQSMSRPRHMDSDRSFTPLRWPGQGILPARGHVGDGDMEMGQLR